MRRLHLVSRWLALLAVLGLLAACGAGPGANPAGTAAQPGRLKVVATFSILGDLVKQVAGDRVELHTIVGPGADTHTYEPAPSDLRALADATLVFENGLGFETWLDKLYASSGSRAQRVVVTQGITPLTIGAGQERGEADPHAWQDVTLASSLVAAIRDALARADPANAQAYQVNAAAYLQELQGLDQFIQQQVAALPAERRKLVTNHDSLGYYARRYGFTVLGDVLGSVSTEASEPSADELARLVDAVKSAGVPVIFTENVENSKVIERIAQEAGVKVGAPLYTDALGQPGTEGETYVKLMRYNTTAIVTALKP